MKTIFQAIGLFVVVIMIILLVLYLFTGVYAFITWDWDVVLNLHHWYNPATNILVRVIMVILAIASLLTAKIGSQLG